MSWRIAQEADVPAIEQFLYRHVQSSMFPLSNLRKFGLNGVEPHAMRIWVLGDDVRAVLSLTNEGMVLPQCPNCTETELRQAVSLIADRRVIGIIGDAAQTRRIAKLAGWQDRDAILDEDEPAFSLDLKSLILPNLPGSRLVPLSHIEREEVVEWRRAYLVETPGFKPEDATRQAECDIDTYLAHNSHRALLVDGEPVGMTGFNATLPDVVQVGGVFIPHNLRGRGYARRAVALHLAEAREAGVTRSVLFAASDSATRAYIANGFAPAGKFALIFFQQDKEKTA